MKVRSSIPGVLVLATILGVTSGALSTRAIWIRLSGFPHDLPLFWVPGLIFAVIVIGPLGVKLGVARKRTMIAAIASSLVYPSAYQITVASVLDHSGGLIVAYAMLSGFIGSAAIAVPLFVNRAYEASASITTVTVGTIAGAIAGISLLVPTENPDVDKRLGLILVFWQTVVAIALASSKKRFAQPVAHANAGRAWG